MLEIYKKSNIRSNLNERNGKLELFFFLTHEKNFLILYIYLQTLAVFHSYLPYYSLFHTTTFIFNFSFIYKDSLLKKNIYLIILLPNIFLLL